MNNEIIPTGGRANSLSFWQNRELEKTEQSALLSSATVVAKHRVGLVKMEVTNVEKLTDIRHTEERGMAAVNAATRVIDAAMEAVGDSEFKSHHISKILNRTTAKLAEQA